MLPSAQNIQDNRHSPTSSRPANPTVAVPLATSRRCQERSRHICYTFGMPRSTRTFPCPASPCHKTGSLEDANEAYHLELGRRNFQTRASCSESPLPSLCDRFRPPRSSRCRFRFAAAAPTRQVLQQTRTKLCRLLLPRTSKSH